MADQQPPVEGDDEPLELTDVVDPNEGDGDDDNRSDDDDPDPNVNDDNKNETIVAFEGEEPEAEPENSTVRQMRQALREKDRRIKELEQSSAPKPIEVGEKPTLASCDYDEDKFADELEAFKDRESAAKRQNESRAEQSRKANEEWQADLGSYEQKKAALVLDDRDDMIDTATSALDMVQQAVVVKAAADPALFLYALGKSEAKRAELAKIQDPIKLAAAVARMEGAVKVTTRKAPAPDKPLSGTARMPGSPDKEIERLEKKAAANGGDRSELIAYKDKLARAAKK